MTTRTDVKNIAPTVAAKSNAVSKGADLVGMQSQILLKCDELRVLIGQFIALHPNGDANLAALNTLLSALA